MHAVHEPTFILVTCREVSEEAARGGIWCFQLCLLRQVGKMAFTPRQSRYRGVTPNDATMAE